MWDSIDPWRAKRAKTNRSATPLGRYRRHGFETLERREVLSASGAAFAPAIGHAGQREPAAIVQGVVDESLAARDQSLAISAVHLLVEGREVTVTSMGELVTMNVGDSFEVVGIDYRLNPGEVLSGKIAFEGYLNKLRGSQTKTDYRDGRFGRHAQEGQLPTGESSHPGLEGAWKMKAGTESLTLVMVRYSADGIATEDRVTIRTQVGTPDFAMSEKISVRGRGGKLTVGNQVRIGGAWANLGEGTYRNYAEVDIYHESDPTKIVWAGTFARTLKEGQATKGEFRNAKRDEQFSRRWVPEQAGTYVLKFYADPENLWAESNEANNTTVVKVEVSESRFASRDLDSHHAIANQPGADHPGTGAGISLEGIVNPVNTPASNEVLDMEEAQPIAESLVPIATDQANVRHRQSSGESHRRGDTPSEFEKMAMELFAAIDGAFGSL